MSVVSNFHALAPVASLTASSDGSGSGSSLLVVALVAAAGLLAVWLIGRPPTTVVVVDKPAVSVGGVVLILVALGILYFSYLGPAAGWT